MNKKINFFTFPVGENRFRSILHGIRQRCNNPNNIAFKNYGGRGVGCLITLKEIIKLWFRDKAYLMKKPTIDRKDNNGHYTYQNCQFIELSENVRKSHKCKHLDRTVLNCNIINYQI